MLESWMAGIMHSAFGGKEWNCHCQWHAAERQAQAVTNNTA